VVAGAVLGPMDGAVGSTASGTDAGAGLGSGGRPFVLRRFASPALAESSSSPTGLTSSPSASSSLVCHAGF
jgi:hypothetical protein